MQDTKENRLKILSQFGYEQFKNRNYVEAIIYYNRYIEMDQTNPVVYNMLGYLYQKLNKYETLDDQIKFFEKSVQLKPDYIQAIRNLALAYPLRGQFQEGINCFHKLFKLGAVTDDYMAYACLKIKLKDFDEGWKYYEYRFLKEYSPTEYPEIDKPKWEGQKIQDKTLLVQCEQGFGDSIQFFRYLNEIKPLVKKIIFRVQNELVELLKPNVNNVDIEIIGTSKPLKEIDFDYHIALMSLLNATKARFEDIPAALGYLKANENKIKEFKKKYFDTDCLKIGIAWNGTKFGNRSRDIPLQCFYPLTELKGVKIYSFQKGYGAEQLETLPLGIEIVDLGKTFGNFSDTAAAMSNLDLFITSDNALFNLAGAMGIKTFVMLNKHSEWRWFFDDETTPWYEKAKIFKKQNESDDWDLLMQKIIENLKIII